MSSAGRAGARQRREEIIALAAQLIARKGIAGTTVREISEAAGILPGSLYHHFESKDEIIDVLMSGYLEELLARYREAFDQAADVTAAFFALVRASMLCIEGHREATVIYQNEVPYFRDSPRFAHIRREGQRARTIWIEVIEQAVAEGVFRDDIPARQLHAFLRDGLWQSVRWFRPNRGYGYEELAGDYGRLFHQAFAAPATLRKIIAASR